MESPFQLERAREERGLRVRLSGAATPEACAALARALAEPAARVELDLEELDDPDGPGVARLVDLLRAAARAGELVVHAAPAMLAHTLYKVGALGPRLTLRDPREAPRAG